MSESIPSDELLARYLTGEISADERATIEAWAAVDPAHRVELDRLYSAWRSRTPSSQWDVNKAWAEVASKLDAPAVSVLVRAPEKVRRLNMGTFALRAAAVVLVTVGIAYAWRARNGVESSGATLMATGIGEQRDTLLADSTRVTLGPSSTLRIASGYGTGARSLTLTGEGWFEVRHDAARPFSVDANGSITQDIGTAFSIRALPGDSVVRVTVVDGVASLRRSGVALGDAVTLRANEVGVLASSAMQPRVERSSASPASWRLGQLTFDNAPLTEVIAELRRWYPRAFVIAGDSVGARRLSATLPARDLREALDILALSLRVTVEQRGDTVRLR